ncbi:MAG: MFS transporter [Gammaproteobacteria bacterium]
MPSDPSASTRATPSFAAVAYPTLAMLGILTMSSMAVFTVSVLAPVAAPDLGLDATLIGAWMALAYLTAMFSGTVTGSLIDRLGAIRVCQLTLTAAGSGLAVFSMATPAAALLSAILLGGAYGTFNPASAHVLAGLGSAKSRPFIFSVKQSGVPVGGVFAGALVPWLALGLGWRGSALVVASLSLLFVAALQPLRAHFDASLRPSPVSLRATLINPVRRTLGDPVLRRFTLAAFCFASGQVTVGAFMVTYYVESLGYTLVAAGTAFAFLQAGAVGGRLVWGGVAERFLSSTTVLAILGLVVAFALVATAFMTTHWSASAVIALGIALGAGSMGWNGVLLARVAALAPLGRAGEITGGLQFVMFSAVVVVPPLFGAAVELAGGFTAPFVVLALFGVTGAGLCLSIRARMY